MQSNEEKKYSKEKERGKKGRKKEYESQWKKRRKEEPNGMTKDREKEQVLFNRYLCSALEYHNDSKQL